MRFIGKDTFIPLLTDTEVKGPSFKEFGTSKTTRVQARPNGVDQRFTFKNVWELYQKLHFPLLEKQTKDTILKHAKNFSQS